VRIPTAREVTNAGGFIICPMTCCSNGADKKTASMKFTGSHVVCVLRLGLVLGEKVQS